MSRDWMTLTLCGLLAVCGCQQSEEYSDYEKAPLSENTETGHSHGPAHGGTVIEFDAAHAHHAEAVFDEQSRNITLYFYGAEIGTAHPAEGLVVELEEGDDEIHLEAEAAPLEGETEETASCYVIDGSQIPEGITSLSQLHGHFHVTMDGNDFRGDLGHAHEHGEEGHDHGEEGHDEDGDDHGDEHGDDEDGEDAPAEDAPAEDAPAEDAPAEDAPAEDAPAEDAPAEEESADEEGAEESADDAPAEEPAEEESADSEEPAEEEAAE